MSYALNIADQKIEKNSLVVVRPRVRLSGWTNVIDADTWVADFTLGYVTKVFPNYDDSDDWTESATSPPGSQEWYYDHEEQKIYVNNLTADPDDAVAMEAAWGCGVGFTIEYELNLSNKAFTAPRDPLDSTSQIVDWLPVLESTPEVSVGSRTNLYGFNPIEESTIRINNQDGYFNRFLHESSFNFAVVRSYILADSDLEHGITNSNVKEVFRGFANRFRWDGRGTISISTTSFLALLDRKADPAARFSTAEFPLVDPVAVNPGAEYWIRRVRGMVDNFIPVNVDYNATAAVNVNRDWVTHEGLGTDGMITHVVDHLAANTNTKTFFTTTAKLNVGDQITLNHSGTPYYTIVDTVNRAGKFITHGSLAGRVIIAADNCIRYYIGFVRIKDENDNWWNLFPGRDYVQINTSTFSNDPDWLGFRLTDDFEATISFTGGLFDPAIHTIICRVYGSQIIDTYSDMTDVGAVSDEGGVASQAVSTLHWLLRQAGIENSMIDVDTFEDVTSYDLGLAIPDTVSGEPETYQAVITKVLTSMIWKLGYSGIGSSIKIGLIPTAPFISSSNYDIDDTEFSDFSYDHEYSDIYDRIILRYWIKELEGELNQTQIKTDQYAVGINTNARDLHQVRNDLRLDTLHFVATQAEITADRYAFALGERRAFYQMQAPIEFVDRANFGASFNFKRQQMPGFEFEYGTEQEKQLALVEVQKSGRGATLSLEDQKGIQDHSGDW